MTGSAVLTVPAMKVTSEFFEGTYGPNALVGYVLDYYGRWPISLPLTGISQQ